MEAAASVAPNSLSVIPQEIRFYKCEPDVSVNTTRVYRVVTVSYRVVAVAYRVVTVQGSDSTG
jgi:hypothetical protein